MYYCIIPFKTIFIGYPMFLFPPSTRHFFFVQVYCTKSHNSYIHTRTEREGGGPESITGGGEQRAKEKKHLLVNYRLQQKEIHVPLQLLSPNFEFWQSRQIQLKSHTPQAILLIVSVIQTLFS